MGLPCQGQIKSRKAVHHCGFSLFLQSLADEEWNSFCAKSNGEQDVPYDLKPLSWFAICSFEEEKGPGLFLEEFNAIWSLGRLCRQGDKTKFRSTLSPLLVHGWCCVTKNGKFYAERWTDLRCKARQQLVQYSWGGLLVTSVIYPG